MIGNKILNYIRLSNYQTFNFLSSTRFIKNATRIPIAPLCTTSPSLVEQYNKDGYVIVRDVLNSDMIEDASCHVNWLQKQHPDVDPELLEHWLMRDDPYWIRGLVSNPNILDIVEQFLGPNLAIFASHYVCKPPRIGKKIHMHQDGSYWPLNPMKVLSIWLAVDRSDEGNGCMYVIPGSHNQGLKDTNLSAEDFDKHIKEVHAGKTTKSGIDESKRVNIILNPGDISIHHPNLWHASTSNTSARRRCGLTMRYIPTSTQVVLDEDNDPDKESKGSVFLVRGNVDSQVKNPYRQIPSFDSQRHFSPANIRLN